MALFDICIIIGISQVNEQIKDESLNFEHKKGLCRSLETCSQ